MRKLLYVPIIHMSADLGSIAPVALRKGKALYGEELWEHHNKTISEFWDVLKSFFRDMYAQGLKIYQDGMLAHGDAGRKIVEEAVEKGSENYRIVLDLMKRGAELMLTEDYQLAMKERDLLVNLSRSEGTWRRLLAYIKYKSLKRSLLKRRDLFIVSRIGKTLDAGETGVLFIGASHNILSRLPGDIEVVTIKDPERIAAYQKSILRAAISGNRGAREVEQSSKYLRQPVEVSLDLPA